MSFIKYYFLLFILSASIPSHSQVPGCKDPAANNYNPGATINNGKCTYNQTFYTPPVKVDPINPALPESSGLQMAGDFLWTFNDSDGDAAIYRIDTVTNAILQTVNLSGATNVDWEDIAFDGIYLYVGDFGNNANGARTDLKIYKFSLAAIPNYISAPNTTIPAAQIEVINFTYSDQAQPPIPSTVDNIKFDCEAMIIDQGKIHLFTKNRTDNSTTHYVINSLEAGAYIATPLETLDIGYLVTGVDKSPGNGVVALLGYQVALPGNHFIHLLSDYSGGFYFNGNKRRIDLPDATIMGQAEGITFRNSSYGYISNERIVRTVGPFTLMVNQRLRSFNISNFIPVYVLPLEIKKFSVTNVNGSHKISWQFVSLIKNLELQYSTDAMHFTRLKFFSSSKEDFLYNKPAGNITYYRLAWRRDNSALQYSNVISIKNEAEDAISNFLFKSSGELSFIIKENAREKYSFKLSATDGKSLSQIPPTYYSKGLNKIYFPMRSFPDSFILLTVYNGIKNTTVRLPVGK